jgi:hypothetical protein
MQDTSQKLVQKWGNDVQEGRRQSKNLVKIDNDVANATADMIARVALGKDSDLLNHPSDNKAAKDIKRIDAVAYSMGRTLIDFWRLPFSKQAALGGPMRRILNLIQAGVEEEESNLRIPHEENEKGHDSQVNHSINFLGKLLGSMKSHDMELAQHRILGNVMTLFLGGLPSTSKTLTRALYMLAKDPELQKELRQEADAVHLESMDADMIYTSLPRLKSFFHEIHRCFGVALLHLQIEEDLPFRGALLPKGANLILLGRYISMSNYDPSLDGSNKHAVIGESGAPPSDFDPRRYLYKSDKDGSYACSTPRHGTFFGGFGYGMRHCPGRHMAELFSYSVVALLLQQFEVELAPRHIEPREIYSVVQALHCKVTLKLSKREANSH